MGQRREEVRRARSRRIARIAAVLALGALLLGWRATRPAGNHRPELHAELAAAAARAGDGGTLELAQVAGFAWDRAVVFHAYTRRADFEDGLGFAWSPQSWAMDQLLDSPLPSDSLQLLVLVRGEDEVAGWCILNEPVKATPGYLRFVQPDGALSGRWPAPFQVWTRPEARFRVRDERAVFEGSLPAAWTLEPVAR